MSVFVEDSESTNIYNMHRCSKGFHIDGGIVMIAYTRHMLALTSNIGGERCLILVWLITESGGGRTQSTNNFKRPHPLLVRPRPQHASFPASPDIHLHSSAAAAQLDVEYTMHKAMVCVL